MEGLDPGDYGIISLIKAPNDISLTCGCLLSIHTDGS